MYPTLQTNKQKKMNGKIIIGLFSVNSATVHSRRLLPFLRDVLISLANLDALGNHILTLQGRSNALLQLFLPLLGLDLKLEIIIGLFTVYSATVPTRRLLPFLRDVLISLVKKARRAIDTWCMFSSSAKPSLYCCNNALSTAATASFPGLDSDPDLQGKIAKYDCKLGCLR